MKRSCWQKFLRRMFWTKRVRCSFQARWLAAPFQSVWISLSRNNLASKLTIQMSEARWFWRSLKGLWQISICYIQKGRFASMIGSWRWTGSSLPLVNCIGFESPPLEWKTAVRWNCFFPDLRNSQWLICTNICILLRLPPGCESNHEISWGWILFDDISLIIYNNL